MDVKKIVKISLFFIFLIVLLYLFYYKFYRIDKSRGLNKSGVGLGLSIAQDIVKSHGGNIKLSKSKMGGLLVKISLPF